MTVKDMVEAKRIQLNEEKMLVSDQQMREQASIFDYIPRDLHSALQTDRLAIVGPVTKSSPYSKATWGAFDAAKAAALEQERGADAILVATESTFFGGQKEYIGAVRTSTQLPIILYDCIIDAYQLYAAVTLGVDAVVLMAAALDSEILERFMSLSNMLGLQVVVEVHTSVQLDAAMQAGATMLMVRNNELEGGGSLEVTQRLALDVPDGDLLISLGCIQTVHDLEMVASWGANAACPERRLLTGADGAAIKEALARFGAPAKRA